MNLELVGKVFDLAVGEVFSEAVRRVMSKYIAGARAAIIDEFARGKLAPSDVLERDEIVAMMIALVEAVRRGAAIGNVRIIARVLAKKAHEPNERPADFLMWSEMIASLTPSEAYFLGTLAQFEDPYPTEDGSMIDHGDAPDRLFAEAIVAKGSPFRTYEEAQATGLGLMRTGCVKPIVLSSNGFRFAGTSKLKLLADMVRRDEAASRVLEEIGLSNV